MKLAFVAIIIAFSAQAFANTTCSDSTGMTRINQTDYQGGAAPMPGYQIGEIRIYENNKLASDSRFFSGGKESLGPLVATYDNSTVHSFVSKRNGASDYSVYGVLVTINVTDLSSGLKPISTYMICTHTVRYLPE